VVAAACGDDDDDGRLKVVATTSQIAALTREVAGDRVSIPTLIAPGAEAHDFEPDPGQVRRIHDADLVLRNGIGLDDFLDGVVEGSAKGRVVTVTDGVDVQPGAGHSDEGQADDDRGEADPHVWHDVDNAKQMTFNIAEALSEADPAGASFYDENARDYAAVLDETDREIRALLDPIPAANRKMVTNHDAFGYFIRRYNLEFVGAVIPSVTAGSEPSAGEIADLQDLIEGEGVRAIFAEAELDARVAEQLSRDTGVEIVDDLYADSLGPEGSEAGTVHGCFFGTPGRSRKPSISPLPPPREGFWRCRSRPTSSGLVGNGDSSRRYRSLHGSQIPCDTTAVPSTMVRPHQAQITVGCIRSTGSTLRRCT
jgi:ABC-type Zn uptake system ZnuABC Zn-binding protein ZnuA